MNAGVGVNVGDVEAVFPGAEVAVDLSVINGTWDEKATVTRARLAKNVALCRRCDLHDGPRVRMAVDDPTRPATFAVLSDQMTAGQRGWLEGIIQSAFRDEGVNVAWCNVVSCQVEGRTTPPIVAQARCRPWMLDQLDIADTRYVLLMGGVALRAWRSDFTVGAHVGRVGLWGDAFVVMAAPHPGTTLMAKGAEKRQGVKDLQGWMDDWVQVVRGGERAVWDALPTVCSKASCASDHITYVDRDGQPWCGVHEDLGRVLWERARDEWVERAAVPESVAVELPMEMDA